MSNEHPYLKLLRAYFSAIEQGVDESALGEFFAPDVRQRELPNRLVTAGAERGLKELLEGRRRGRNAVTNERYVIQNALVDGERVAVEVTWSAQLKVPLGKLQPGDTLSAHCGAFFRIVESRIAEQHNYDCFESF
jgi:ketosteroid isomerase-like protein